MTGAAKLREGLARGIRTVRRLSQRFPRLVHATRSRAAARGQHTCPAPHRMRCVGKRSNRSSSVTTAASSRPARPCASPPPRRDRARRVERGQHLQLVIARAARLRARHLRQRLAGRRLAGRGAAGRFFQGLARRWKLIEVPLHEADHVIGLAKRWIEREGPLQGVDCGLDPAIPVPRESKLVEDARVTLVERNERLVLLDGAVGAAEADVDARASRGAQRDGVEPVAWRRSRARNRRVWEW